MFVCSLSTLQMLSILLLFTYLQLTNQASIDCSLQKSSVGCQQMSGCTWSGTTCQGTYVPPCNPPTCHYIFPEGNNTNANPTGKHDDPFNNFTQAISVTQTTDTLLYVATDVSSDNAHVAVSSRTVINADIKIKPLLNTNFTLNFTGAFKEVFDSNFDDGTTYSDSQCGIRCDSNGHLSVSNAFMIGHSFNKRVFMSCCKQANNISFDMIYLIDQVHNDNQVMLAYKEKGHLTVNNSIFSNTSIGVIFSRDAYVHFYHNKFEEIYIKGSFISSGDLMRIYFINNTLNNIKPLGPLSQFFQLSEYAGSNRVLYVQDNVLTNIFATFIRSDSLRFIHFLGNTFKNIHMVSPDQRPLIVLRGESAVIIKLTSTNDVFENITVRGTVIYAENLRFTMVNSTWKNITKLYNPEYLVQYEALDYLINRQVTGSCVMMTTFGKLDVQDSTFTSINANCLAAVKSQLLATNVVFNNTDLVNKNSSYWDQYETGVSWISIYEANPSAPSINIEKVQFIQSGGVPQYGAGINIRSVYPMDIIINEANFSSLQAQEGGGFYSKVSVGSLTMSNCIFNNNTAKHNGGALYIQGQSESAESYFKNSISHTVLFENTAGSNGGGAFLHTTNLHLYNLDVVKNKAYNGGGIYLNKQISPVQVTNSNSSKPIRDVQLIINTVQGLGPAIMLANSNEALFTTPASYFSTMMVINSNTIEQTLKNINRTWGLDEIAYNKPTSFRVRVFEVLSVEETNQATDFSKMTSNSNLTTLKSEFDSTQVPQDLTIDVKSGHRLPMLIEVAVLDQNKQLMVTVNDEFVDFTLELADQSDTTTKIVAFSDAFQSGVLNIKDQIEFIGKNGSEATLHINSNTQKMSPLLRDLGAVLSFSVKVAFKPCEKGDIYNSKTLQCITCAPGTYTFGDPYDSQASCMECTENADCIRGAMISPKPGYYRYDSTTVNFRKCEVEDSCLGGVVDSVYHPQGKCKPPYYGNLCSQCDYESAKFGGAGQCQSCKNNFAYYLKFVILFAVSIITILTTIWLNLRRAVLMKEALDNKDEAKMEIVKHSAFNAVVLKIAINFTLTKEVIADYGFKWPTFVNSVLSSLMNMFPTAQEGFSIDCFIVLISNEYENVFYIKLISTILKPIALWFSFLFLYFFFRKCFYRKQKLTSAEVKDRIILIFLAISYMNQSEIITSCLQLFKCSNFSSSDSPQYFLDANPQIQCFTDAHLKWGLGFGISFFILWGIVFPILLFVKIKQVANDAYKRLRYSFIFAGLKHEYYYWEFVILLRKQIMVLILVFLRAFQTGGQIFLSMVVLGFFTYIQLSKRPFNDKKLNDLEFYSLISCIIMLVVGYFFYIQDKNGASLTSYILSFIAVLSNLIFYALLAYNIIQSIRRNMKRVANAVKNKVLTHYKLISQAQASNRSIDITDNAENGENISPSRKIIKRDSSPTHEIIAKEQSQDPLLADISRDQSTKDQISILDGRPSTASTASTKNLDLGATVKDLNNSSVFSPKKKSLFGRALDAEPKKFQLTAVNIENCVDFDQSINDASSFTDASKKYSESDNNNSDKRQSSPYELKELTGDHFFNTSIIMKPAALQLGKSKKKSEVNNPFIEKLEVANSLQKESELSDSFEEKIKVCEDIEQDFSYFCDLKNDTMVHKLENNLQQQNNTLVSDIMTEKNIDTEEENGYSLKLVDLNEADKKDDTSIDSDEKSTL